MQGYTTKEIQVMLPLPASNTDTFMQAHIGTIAPPRHNNGHTQAGTCTYTDTHTHTHNGHHTDHIFSVKHGSCNAEQWFQTSKADYNLCMIIQLFLGEFSDLHNP